MYALINESGEYARGRHCRFTYHSHQFATVAARILGKRDGCRYTVVAA